MNKRYEIITKMGEGGMGVVFHVRDRLTNQHIALKSVHIGTFEQDEQREVLAREFQTLAGLRHPNIVSVLDYGFDVENRPYFTMSLLNEPQSITEACASRTFYGKLDLIVQMLQALAYLHRQGILHRDLKPNNVLVTPDGRVQLVDFGLAVSVDDDIQLPVGTVLYMAPELVNGKGNSEASDLFAVGTMAYEIISGVHPFAAASVSRAINRILLETTDMSIVTNAVLKGLDESIGDDTRVLIPQMPYKSQVSSQKSDHQQIAHDVTAVIARLMDKSPEARDLTPYDVIEMLCKALNIAEPVESAAIRRSFLRGARFVGRSDALAQLNNALEKAVQGTGSAWLIDGEFGVGKTRLIAEHRIHALVKGVNVIQATAGQGSNESYTLSRQILPQLLLLENVSSVEARTLKHLIPEIDNIVGFTVQDPAGTLAQAIGRIQRTLLDMLKRIARPTLLIVEDLQWAQDDMFFLRELTGMISKVPLLMVGSYRSDEAPYLYGNFHYTHSIHLSRLTSSELKELSRSMLGRAGEDTGVLQMLERESEGNIAFAIDILQNLGQRFSRLDALNKDNIPTVVQSESIMDVARRRVMRLPLDFQPLMRLAAVAGREIDFQVLRQYDYVTNLTDWTNEGMNAAILTNRNNKWQFAHDKLREGILYGIMPEERNRLHRLVADALVTLYPDDPDQRLKAIQHWEDSGDLQGAIERIEASVEVFAKTHRQDDLEQVIRDYLEKIDEDDKAARLKLLQALSHVQVGNASDIERIELYGQMLALSQSLQDPQSEADALSRLAWMQVVQNNLNHAQKYCNQLLEVATQLHDDDLLAKGFGMLAIIMDFQNNTQKAIEYNQRVIDIYRRLDKPDRAASFIYNIGGIHLQRGNFAGAKARFDEVMSLLKDDYTHHQVYGFCLMAFVRYYRFNNDFEIAMNYCQQAIKQFETNKDTWGLVNAHYHTAYLHAIQDKWMQARTALRSVQEALDQFNTARFKIRVYCLNAIIEAHQGQAVAARGALVQALKLHDATPHDPTLFNTRQLLHAMAHVARFEEEQELTLTISEAFKRDFSDLTLAQEQVAWLERIATAKQKQNMSQPRLTISALLTLSRHRLKL